MTYQELSQQYGPRRAAQFLEAQMCAELTLSHDVDFGKIVETSAGAVAGVAMPMGGMKRRNKKKTESEQFPGVKTPNAKQIARKHGVPLSQIKDQLRKGWRVELEHTIDWDVAKEIALDHLNELPDYYDRLADVEEGNRAQLGIPANATKAELEKIRSKGGKSGQRAHWLLNMRKGNKKQ